MATNLGRMYLHSRGLVEWNVGLFASGDRGRGSRWCWRGRYRPADGRPDHGDRPRGPGRRRPRQPGRAEPVGARGGQRALVAHHHGGHHERHHWDAAEEDAQRDGAVARPGPAAQHRRAAHHLVHPQHRQPRVRQPPWRLPPQHRGEQFTDVPRPRPGRLQAASACHEVALPCRVGGRHFAQQRLAEGRLGSPGTSRPKLSLLTHYRAAMPSGNWKKWFYRIFSV